VDALGSRRGAAQKQQGAGASRALGGEVSGVVAGVALVLVGAVVLLVDDDQAGLLDRSEDGRSRANAHARLPPAQPPPLRITLARAQARVQHRDGIAEA